jgi:hypothetical protein
VRYEEDEAAAAAAAAAEKNKRERVCVKNQNKIPPPTAKIWS